MSRAAFRSYSSAAAPLKVAARDAPGNLTTLSVIVNNAGSKAGKSGVAHLLSKFNFMNTESKSALRFTRESELLGGVVSTDVTRDAIVLKTQFLKEDLPYYVEALGNVLTKTSFRPHELPETVLPAALNEYENAHASNAFVASEALHEISFRRGYGHPLYYDGTKTYTSEDVAQFASEVYTAGNVSIVASGAVEADLVKFIGESAFSELPTGSTSAVAVKAYTGKEARVRVSGQSLAVIGVPIKPAEFAKYDILSATIGSAYLPATNTPLFQIPGASSQVYKYQDAGLFVVSVAGSDSAVVAEGIKKVKAVVDSITASDLSKSVKAAKLAVALESTLESPLEYAIDASAAKGGKLSSFNYVAVGDVDVLPFADEL
ncbi:ubiquinol-cytochrome c reductase core subunit 1 [Yamadazyma tenuis]|uniref:Cytochrome b-c1 complex subunit 2, mitochondrial n=1 Tax=Candida tenuis (strain ATCC 10573 / BCRC 21748 / CBS 615 / JCM 9827 / NBRC 10315 / NRRL Y-1498 / VKM Y-70) TaxID=590646 RepID=G3B2V5_CANTC|nr:cytochrome b-c1 complex subunit 2 [Yamadazyma tenuis ATCC 10573]EGV64769.1 cytochrome b-c1 complex subunit 2 [Yamadazyma tenuis ATCC 10573]WEJ97562.1 ubiquinol-cytochrome c reductase core subunit 1 [Yamadazyma tenuis]